VAVSKTVMGRKAHREFESLPLRFSSLCKKTCIPLGAGFLLLVEK
jgi:hypothetical protein